MAVTFDVALGAADDVSNPSTLTTPSATVASTANRYVLGASVKDDQAVTTNSAAFDAAMTALAAEFAGAFPYAFKSRVFERIAPASGSQTFSVTYSAGVGRAAIAAVVFNDVHQTTPRNSTATPVTGSVEDPETTGSATITVTTVANGRAVGTLCYYYDAGVAPTIVARTGCAIRRHERAAVNGIVLFDRADNSGSTEVGVDITIAATSNLYWRLEGEGIQPAQGGVSRQSMHYKRLRA